MAACGGGGDVVDLVRPLLQLQPIAWQSLGYQGQRLWGTLMMWAWQVAAGSERQEQGLGNVEG